MIVRLLLLGIGLAVLGVLAVVGVFAWYGRDLPSFSALSDYHPPQVTRVYDRTGTPVAEFFHERRTVVPKEKIPKLVKQAVVAAEDNHFYEHHGLDYLGIVRAVVQDLRHMRLAQGASTITQQVVKNMVLSPERSLARKVKEAMLARRIEQNLSKEEILFLYLNHIYYGHNRYGIEEAARFYFGKSVDKLSLGEAAMLAGIPQSPGKLSPLRNPDKAKVRQTYVLNQMAENGFITKAQAEAEIKKPITLAPESFENVGPYYGEEVRQRLVQAYGEEKVYEGGMRVELGMDAKLQAAADAALKQSLEELDRRHGFRTPEVSVETKALEDARAPLLAKFEKPLATRATVRPVPVWDFDGVTADDGKSGEALAKKASVRALEQGLTVFAPVKSVSDAEVVIDLGKLEGVIPFERIKWARPYGPGKWTKPPTRASDVVTKGQVVRVRVLELPNEKAKDARVSLDLAPRPAVQGALVSIDPKTREVVALSGGYDFELSAFNRATQAKRQPGSSFKPFVYAAALASGKFTTASILNDAPDVIRDPFTGKSWKPQNFERDEYEGPMGLREALSKSKNTISVRLIEAVGPQAVIDMARRAGISSAIPENFTIALGTAEVTPLELANAYTTLATLGKRADPVLITKVMDASGKVLEEHHAVPEETIPPAIAYITTSLMRSVVEMGTGVRAQELSRPVAGKTGTASGTKDGWFSGFTPDLVTTSWAGFDDHNISLGSSETGGHSALPAWLYFMKVAMDGRPKLDFTPPPGVEQVRIDPKTGLRAQDDAPGRNEVFAEGTAPKEYANKPGEANPSELFLEDGGRGSRP